MSPFKAMCESNKRNRNLEQELDQGNRPSENINKNFHLIELLCLFYGACFNQWGRITIICVFYMIRLRKRELE